MSESPRIVVRIDSDALKAFVSILKGDSMSVADLEGALKEAGVTHGILDDARAELGGQLGEAEFSCDETVIARGDRGEDGSNGELVLEPLLGEQSRKVRDDGSIDHRQRSTLQSVEAGQPLATYRSATPGIKGMTVTGVEIEHENGVEQPPELGPGVTSDPATGKIVAARSGIVCHVEGGMFDVSEFVQIDSDVDFDSGNIDVDAAVQITGSILPGFQVTTTGDVVVDGRHCEGTIKTTANVMVAGGILAGDNAEVRAQGGVVCRHAQGGTIRSGGTIEIGDHCVDSHLWARKVHATRGRGKVLGGELHALESIHVLEAGSALGTVTLLAVAEPDEAQLCMQRPIPNAAEIVVAQDVHPGVVVRIGTRTTKIVDALSGVRFTLDPEDGTIRMGSP